MGRRLSDEEKKKIVADYINTQNYCETARINNVSEANVRRIIKEDKNIKDISEKCEQKKEQNTRDILKYMDSIYEKQKSIIDLSLSALEKKLKNPDMFTNVKDIATVYGVIFDKALKYKEIQIKTDDKNKSDEINKNILDLANLINNPAPERREEDIE